MEGKKIVFMTDQIETFHPPNATQVPSKMRFLYGGAGGMAPVLVSLALADAQVLMDKLEEPYFLAAFAFRTLALFAIGGVWAWMHATEWDPRKLFQLGIVAPAMILGMIHATAPASTDTAESSAEGWGLSFSIVSTAHAAHLAGHETSETVEEPSPAEQIIKGLLGRP
jgi:hypothetical protein